MRFVAEYRFCAKGPACSGKCGQFGGVTTMGITERIDAITLIPPSYRIPAPPPPRSAKIEVTARCDFKCFFCATGMKLRTTGHMSRGLYAKIIQDLRQAGVEELGVFYLGESFILPWLPELIAEAKAAGFSYVFLTTNGRLATPAKVEACIRAGLDSLKFSYNHAGPAQLAETARVPEAWFQGILANLKGARGARDKVREETGHRCGIYASSVRFDGEQQKRMEQAVAEILPYVDEHYWLPLYNQGALTQEACEQAGFKATPGNQGRIGALRAPLPCWAVFTEAHITYDGQLSACCFDHSAAWHMGNLTRQPFLEAWHSPAFQKLRAQHLARDIRGSACARCVAGV